MFGRVVRIRNRVLVYRGIPQGRFIFTSTVTHQPPLLLLINPLSPSSNSINNRSFLSLILSTTFRHQSTATTTMCGGAILADLIPRSRRLNPADVWPNSNSKLNPFQSEFNHFIEQNSPKKRPPSSSGTLFSFLFFIISILF